MQIIRDHGTLDLWLEMCLQHDYPMVATGGYQCIAIQEPTHRFEAALLVIANRHEKASFIFYYPAMIYLGEDVESNLDNFSTFTKFACLPTTSLDGRRIAVALLPQTFLADWIEAEEIQSTPPDVQALAVDAAVVAHIDNDTDYSPKLEGLLQAF